jgi:hypothetical protein
MPNPECQNLAKPLKEAECLAGPACGWCSAVLVYGCMGGDASGSEVSVRGATCPKDDWVFQGTCAASDCSQSWTIRPNPPACAAKVCAKNTNECCQLGGESSGGSTGKGDKCTPPTGSLRQPLTEEQCRAASPGCGWCANTTAFGAKGCMAGDAKISVKNADGIRCLPANWQFDAASESSASVQGSGTSAQGGESSSTGASAQGSEASTASSTASSTTESRKEEINGDGKPVEKKKTSIVGMLLGIVFAVLFVAFIVAYLTHEGFRQCVGCLCECVCVTFFGREPTEKQENTEFQAMA